MRQLFAPGADAWMRLVLLSLLLLAGGSVLILEMLQHSAYVSRVGIAPEQPVPFSHKHHVGELGIDCRYCHTGVEVSASAGLPPTHTCMTCHSQLWTGAAMLAPVRDSLARDQPLAWVRVHRLPDYVYFNHSIHIAKGVGCSSCHGAVDRMQLTARAQNLTMQFCLDCHRNPAMRLRPPDQVWNTEWTPPADQAARGKAFLALYHIRSGAQLSDCSICHR
ncbi:cytochrome c3 family protein [Lichenicoccus sp.]|uniref:cytochrome c3 family protein n=1 Tax=Lichenicoccus sp. TaxID=2781899 RepID=UPI003D0DB5FE